MAAETKSNAQMEYIEMCDSEGVDKATIIERLRSQGISEQKIENAFKWYYNKQGLYEIIFEERPLGLTLLEDHHSRRYISERLIIAAIENEKCIALGLKIGSRLYEIQGKRVDLMKNEEAKKLIKEQECPFYVVFQEAMVSATKLSEITEKCELICFGFIRMLSKLDITIECDFILVDIFNVAVAYYTCDYRNISSSKHDEKRIFMVDNICNIEVRDIAYINEQIPKGNNEEKVETGIWESKDIDDWDTDELASWILSLGLDSESETTLVTQIREQEVCGADINSCEKGEDIAESFEDINEETGEKIFEQLQNIRLISDSYQNENEDEIDYDDNKYILKDPSRGVIGLNNLGNTCFINCVIQCLLQTPSLIQVLRKWASNGSSSMLDAFIYVAQEATQRNSKYNSVTPSGIVRSLRNSDVRFERGAQGDALSAVSKMIELLDKGIINRQKGIVTPMQKVINHPGSWHNSGILDEDEEDDMIIGNCVNYNPYKSVIRDKMHFIERNILFCMNPKCNYKETRYEFREKVLLPLHDHSVNIVLDIYIPSINKIIAGEQFNVLDYCSVDTLRYAIYKRVSNELKSETYENGFKLQFINQINVKIMKVNRNNELKDWIIDIYPKNECKSFINDNIYIFVLIESLNKSDSKFIVSTFNVFIDENENINSDQSYLQFDEMKDGEIKTFENVNVDRYEKNVYFKQEIVMNEDNNNCECKVDQNDNIIICLWTHESLQKNVNNNDFERKVYDAFLNKYNTNSNRSTNGGEIQGDIESAFDVYLSDKLLDRGAVLNCGRCQRKSDVFMVKTEIVKYPDVLIFTIDRYIDGDKFEEVVDYAPKLEYDNGYELYGVCNHSGTLNGGHYWAYVKGVDDGNWYNANDSSISNMNQSSVINRASAIILMYKKIK